ncbi:hypothetical protein B0J18DRAFT_49557 [Chaetomium sp. MPI-SDFR-AT-0129]|nr:hypothetical protein B0J18DRAFT_49557 [Chaetomium sp. MPI-SDFR-AT-0129]
MGHEKHNRAEVRMQRKENLHARMDQQQGHRPRRQVRERGGHQSAHLRPHDPCRRHKKTWEPRHLGSGVLGSSFKSSKLWLSRLAGRLADWERLAARRSDPEHPGPPTSTRKSHDFFAAYAEQLPTGTESSASNLWGPIWSSSAGANMRNTFKKGKGGLKQNLSWCQGAQIRESFPTKPNPERSDGPRRIGRQGYPPQPTGAFLGATAPLGRVSDCPWARQHCARQHTNMATRPSSTPG